MTLPDTLVSILIGTISGIVYYGLSFVDAQRQGRFFNATQATQAKLPIARMYMSSLRVLMVSFLFYLILRLPHLNPILILVTFICVFWCIILGKDLNLWNRSTTS